MCLENYKKLCIFQLDVSNRDGEFVLEMFLKLSKYQESIRETKKASQKFIKIKYQNFLLFFQLISIPINRTYVTSSFLIFIE